MYYYHFDRRTVLYRFRECPTNRLAQVDAVFGRKPRCPTTSIVMVFHRSSVMPDGVTIKPALALGGWVAFCHRGRRHVMGDLVLLESEINPVMAKSSKAGSRSRRS